MTVVPGPRLQFTKVKFCGTLKVVELVTTKLADVVTKLLELSVNDIVATLDLPRVSVPVKVKLLLRVSVYAPLFGPSNILFQVIPFVDTVVFVSMSSVEPVVTTVPAVYVRFPVPTKTEPETVIVPAVLIVKLFRSRPPPIDHVPVPARTKEVVPDIVAAEETVRLAPTFRVFPFTTVVPIPLKPRFPLIVQLSASVYVIAEPANVNKRVQTTLFEVNVAVAFTVIPFAPACVYPPVPKLTLPETVNN